MPNALVPSSTLSTEALEEFLSILRPTLFRPQSPTLLTRKIPTLAFSHERAHSLSSRPLERLENVPILSPAFRNETRTPFKQTSPRLRTPRQEDEEKDSMTELVPIRPVGSGPLGARPFSVSPRHSKVNHS